MDHRVEGLPARSDGLLSKAISRILWVLHPERFPLDLASYDPDGLLELFLDCLVRIEPYVLPLRIRAALRHLSLKSPIHPLTRVNRRVPSRPELADAARERISQIGAG
jgi:hypothetical protein